MSSGQGVPHVQPVPYTAQFSIYLVMDNLSTEWTADIPSVGPEPLDRSLRLLLLFEVDSEQARRQT